MTYSIAILLNHPAHPTARRRKGARRLSIYMCMTEFSLKSPTLIDVRGGKIEKKVCKRVNVGVVNELGGREGIRSEGGSYANSWYLYGNSGKENVPSCVVKACL